jgi:hypothetical protein
MVSVGDKGVVMNVFGGDKMFIPLGDIEVGDTVAVYNLKDDTRIAVPILSFDIGDYAFATPSFDFAGFNWNLDFDFSLIPLILSLTPAGTYWLTSIVEYVYGRYGSNVDNCLGDDTGTHTLIGDSPGYLIAEFGGDPTVNLASCSAVTIYERTVGLNQKTLNPNNYIEPVRYLWDLRVDDYYISFIMPNKIRIGVKNSGGRPGGGAYGNICCVKAVFT